MATPGISDTISADDAAPHSRRGTPVWEIARLFPVQGEWSEEEYLELARNPQKEMVELIDGVIEFLHLPTEINGEPSPTSRRGTPVWEIAWLYPLQGEWTEADYLALGTNHFVELVDGCLEFPPMPTLLHQLILQALFMAMVDFVKKRRLGTVVFSPCPIRLCHGKLREPDLMFLGETFRQQDLRKPPTGADLVVEIVSPGGENRERDFVDKRTDYAETRIPEYWIVDPEKLEVLVLKLSGISYAVHGVFVQGTTITSLILPELSIPVDYVFAPIIQGLDMNSAGDQEPSL